jgi:hypothetical protein
MGRDISETWNHLTATSADSNTVEELPTEVSKLHMTVYKYFQYTFSRLTCIMLNSTLGREMLVYIINDVNIL